MSRRLPGRRPKALPPPGGVEPEVVEPTDALQEARDTIRDVMKGNGGRNAMARILAAKVVLAKDYLEHLSDDDIIAEIERRQARRALSPPPATDDSK